MKNSKGDSFWKKRISSFQYAYNGFRILLAEEVNIRLHLIVCFIVIIGGVIWNISATEWLVCLVLMAIVLGLEAMNTAIENLCDKVSPQWDETIGKVKDLSAAAVTIAAFISVICGCIVFLPKIYKSIILLF